MPTAGQILLHLKAVTNTLWTLALFWHIYFAVIIVVLLLGVRPSKSICGFLLSLPLLSVSLVAWITSDPIMGVVFALIGFLAIFISFKLPDGKIRVAPLGVMLPGIILYIFGWIYPNFLETTSQFIYLYAAPVGLIPCPTLLIVIGLALILNVLDSRALSLLLGIAGFIFGITGVLWLGVYMDSILFLGSLVILILALQVKSNLKTAEA